MALTKYEKNQETMDVHLYDFDLEDVGVRDLRKIVRAGLAACHRREYKGTEITPTLLVVYLRDGDFFYEVIFKEGTRKFSIARKQSTLDRLAQQYKIKV